MRDILNCLRELECDLVFRVLSRLYNSCILRLLRYFNMFWGFRELIDIVIEVVVLKIKLKYIDMEVKYKVDFERIRV